MLENTDQKKTPYLETFQAVYVRESGSLLLLLIIIYWEHFIQIA